MKLSTQFMTRVFNVHKNDFEYIYRTVTVKAPKEFVVKFAFVVATYSLILTLMFAITICLPIIFKAYAYLWYTAIPILVTIIAIIHIHCCLIITYDDMWKYFPYYCIENKIRNDYYEDVAKSWRAEHPIEEICRDILNNRNSMALAKIVKMLISNESTVDSKKS